MNAIKRKVMLDISKQKASNDPIIPASTTITTTNNYPCCPLLKDKQNLTEEKLSQEQAELDILWDKIQELKLTDEFAAQVMYEKYRVRAGELPPPIPTSSHIIEDQAVS
jgi:hypothetical protein